MPAQSASNPAHVAGPEPEDRDGLGALGWTPLLALQFAPHAAAGRIAGRVIAQARETARAAVSGGVVDVVIQRGFRRSVEGPAGFPAIGDWLALEPSADGSSGLLREVLPRRSAFSRGQADGGGRLGEQVLAANVDVVMLVSALTRDFNLRRLERYLALAWSSGAEPVIVLNKADLCEDVDARIAAVSETAGNTPVHAISARTGDGLSALHRYLQPGHTLCLLGSSGVGKSTLTNDLLGLDVQAVRDVREDDERGRHTTTGRDLFILPGGALLIDTPGLRSVGLWDAAEGVDTTFADIDELARDCRFGDCSHEREPGCAVQSAIRSGALPAGRLERRRKLERELRSAERRSSPAAAHADARRFGKLYRDNARAAEWRNGWRD